MNRPLNEKGVRFIAERTRPLEVDTVAKAGETIDKTIASMIGRDKPVNLHDPDERAAYAKHLAWVIGFDALVEDRRAIHHIIGMVD